MPATNSLSFSFDTKICDYNHSMQGAGYVAWGHSTVVGPFAEVLATTDEKPGIVICEMDFAQVGLVGGKGLDVLWGG